jgi:hypothetical protein
MFLFQQYTVIVKCHWQRRMLILVFQIGLEGENLATHTGMHDEYTDRKSRVLILKSDNNIAR